MDSQRDSMEAQNKIPDKQSMFLTLGNQRYEIGNNTSEAGVKSWLNRTIKPG